MEMKRIFLASSTELKEDRRTFEIAVSRKNKEWVPQRVYLELIVWEDFLDAVSKTRLQDEYNKSIRECDIFVMLFWTKVGRYTEEEFETAFGQFKSTQRPFIFTYFKDLESNIGGANESEHTSLRAFQEKLDVLGHFYTIYKNTDALQLHFIRQLDKLVASGFVELKPDADEAAIPGAITVGAGAVRLGGQNAGSINTGTQVNTDGGAYIDGNVKAGGDFVGRDQIVHSHQVTTSDVSGTGNAIAQSRVTQGISQRHLESLFAPLMAVVAQQTTTDKQPAAVQQIQELKVEVAKGEHADDSRIAKVIDNLVDMVPGAVGSVVSMFSTPILGGIAGPVTKFVLDKLNQS